MLHCPGIRARCCQAGNRLGMVKITLDNRVNRALAPHPHWNRGACAGRCVCRPCSCVAPVVDKPEWSASLGTSREGSSLLLTLALPLSPFLPFPPSPSFPFPPPVFPPLFIPRFSLISPLSHPHSLVCCFSCRTFGPCPVGAWGDLPGDFLFPLNVGREDSCVFAVRQCPRRGPARGLSNSLPLEGCESLMWQVICTGELLRQGGRSVRGGRLGFLIISLQVGLLCAAGLVALTCAYSVEYECLHILVGSFIRILLLGISWEVSDVGQECGG